MGAGGIIIIRRSLRVAANENADTIRGCLGDNRRERFDSIMQKPAEDWTESDFHFVLRSLGKAHDELC
jgi:hypothetical protein